MKATFTRDITNKKIYVVRDFKAPVELVWKAWTTPEILDQWWAPKPWKNITKIMDFRVGGMWLYSMVGPQGEQHWSRTDYTAINPTQSFAGIDIFSDEHGTIIASLPTTNWHIAFESTPEGTRVNVINTFDREEDMLKLIEMGFEGGFNMGLQNLEDLLDAGSIKL